MGGSRSKSVTNRLARGWREASAASATRVPAEYKFRISSFGTNSGEKKARSACRSSKRKGVRALTRSRSAFGGCEAIYRPTPVRTGIGQGLGWAGRGRRAGRATTFPWPSENRQVARESRLWEGEEGLTFWLVTLAALGLRLGQVVSLGHGSATTSLDCSSHKRLSPETKLDFQN